MPAAKRIWKRPAAVGAALFLVSWAACAVFASRWPAPEPYGDAPGYLALARNVSLGLGFSADGLTPASYRPPLFSSLLGAWFKLGGGWVSFECTAESAGVVAAYFLLLEILESEALSAAAALFFFALNPILITHVAYALQEPLLFFMTSLSAWLTLRWLRKPDDRGAAAVGFAWGLTTLAKVVTWYVPLLFWGLWAAGRLWKKTSWRLSARHAALVSLVFGATIFPWTLRNYVRFHRVILVNDQGAAALEWFVSRGTLSEIGGDAYVRELQASPLSAAESSRRLLSYAAAHPRLSLLQILKNFFWFTQYDRQWFGHAAGMSMSWRLWLVPALFFQLPLYAGFFLGARRTNGGRAFLLAFYWLYWLEHAVVWGDPRYAIPVYALLVGLGLRGIFSFRRRPESP